MIPRYSLLSKSFDFKDSRCKLRLLTEGNHLKHYKISSFSLHDFFFLNDNFSQIYARPYLNIIIKVGL